MSKKVEDSFNIYPSYSKLSKDYYSQLKPTPVNSPYWISIDEKVVDLIGLDYNEVKSDKFLNLLSGNSVLGNFTSYSAVYSGHQFGKWAGQLGDGRAITIAETKQKSKIFEIQLKGAGFTPYSRMGDGRAVLRSSIREYLCSEAMYNLGIPTSRALCIVGSKDSVYREEVETSAIVTRVA